MMLTVFAWSRVTFGVLATLLIVLAHTTTGGSLGLGTLADSFVGDRSQEAPGFLNASETTVVTSVGQTTYLHCGVDRLGDRAVSWIRSRDLTILTIGLVRYTRDRRFTAIHADGHNFWGLKIVDPRVEDAGLYECQVSYHDDVEKKLKLPFTLTVLESRASIVGNRDLYMKEESVVELQCSAENVPAPPAFIYWYKEGEVLNYFNVPRININTHTFNNTLISTLRIESASPSDSGNYTCAPANSVTDSVVLHVVKGEQPEGLRDFSNSATEYRMLMDIFLILRLLVWILL